MIVEKIIGGKIIKYKNNFLTYNCIVVELLFDLIKQQACQFNGRTSGSRPEGIGSIPIQAKPLQLNGRAVACRAIGPDSISGGSLLSWFSGRMRRCQRCDASSILADSIINSRTHIILCMIYVFIVQWKAFHYEVMKIQVRFLMEMRLFSLMGEHSIEARVTHVRFI